MVRSASSSIDTARGSCTVVGLRSRTRTRRTWSPSRFARVSPVGPAPMIATAYRRGVMPSMARPGSTSEERLTPLVEGVLLVRPDTHRPIAVHDLELGRNLDPVAVRIVDHDEEVVPGAVPARPPDELDALAGEVIRPIANQGPVARFIGVMIEPPLRSPEHRQGMVLHVGAEPAGGDRIALHRLVGALHSNDAGVESHHGLRVVGRHDHMLEPRAER